MGTSMRWWALHDIWQCAAKLTKERGPLLLPRLVSSQPEAGRDHLWVPTPGTYSGTTPKTRINPYKNT